LPELPLTVQGKTPKIRAVLVFGHGTFPRCACFPDFTQRGFLFPFLQFFYVFFQRVKPFSYFGKKTLIVGCPDKVCRNLAYQGIF